MLLPLCRAEVGLLAGIVAADGITNSIVIVVAVQIAVTVTV